MIATLQSLLGARPIHWIGLSLLILLLDYATGPYIQVSILFVFPVVLASAGQGGRVGMAVAVLLPIVRLGFFFRWPLVTSWQLQSVDTAVDILCLTVIAILVDRMVRQERELHVLEGMLRICTFCKRIRDDQGKWRQLESYIAERSAAEFSHTFCPDCGQRHYPGITQ